ncbi:MAG: N-methyl-transferase [Parcubacteria group bacterium Gr01-1014_29]|nr:MAG: N-methyl-transferase [Parcubacteria group bacterium Gr01-1014_29]
MESENLQNPEVQRVGLLEKINKALADLGSTGKWKRAPEFLEGYAPLRDKTVVMVDDVKTVLENFAPHLMVATDGKASFVEYKGQKLDELIQQIMEYNPNIVVMDYHLSENMKGSSVIKALKKQNFAGEAVGFSSDNHTTKEFMDAGAKGAVDKGGYSPEKSVEELANLISKE